jgi:hypothetical protein
MLDQIDTRVFAAIEAAPGSTAKDLTLAFGGPETGRSQLRNQVYAALNRLRFLGRIESSGYPQRWAPSDQGPAQTLDPEYVELVIERLVKLREDAPERLHHAIDYCSVDLMRALGRVPG